jgi:predicted RNA binding protein YcfA (HicA-like mRNA interferase family)
MPRLKNLSGDKVISILSGFGFEVRSQRGSHVKLRRTVGGHDTQVLTIPKHRELDMGTLYAIFRQACRFVPEDELRKKFYSD